MKYIIFRQDGLEFPVLFSGHLSHANIAELFAPARAVPVSAGFVRFSDGSVSTHDRSLSLNLSPREGDSMFIGAHYRAQLGAIGVKQREPGRWHISDEDPAPRPVVPPPATAAAFEPDPSAHD